MKTLTCGCDYIDSLIVSFCEAHKYPGPDSHKDGKGIIIRDLEAQNAKLRGFMRMIVEEGHDSVCMLMSSGDYSREVVKCACAIRHVEKSFP